ncbi:MAG: Type and secretion system protein [Verrucomicrobiales bacterium]|nr:Type and secretion system protein [Verrucomicrobiales bacterium]
MKKLILMLGIGLSAGILPAFAQSPAPAASTATTEISTNIAEVMPLITIEDAPLTDAIKTLARQAGINFQFDPKVLQLSNAPVTIRFENVTALQALSAVLENHGLQLSQDAKTKIARVTTKEAPGLEPLVTKVVHLHYSNSTNMIPIIKATFGSARSQVIADNRTGQLVLVATEKEISAISDILIKLDSSPSQILIEARFIETSQNPKTSKGIDWTKTVAAQNVQFGNTLADPTAHKMLQGVHGPLNLPNAAQVLPLGAVPGLPQISGSTMGSFAPWVLNAEGVKAVLSFLNSSDETQTLATPRAVALEGIATELSVVQDIPIFEETQGTVANGVVQASTVKPNYNVSGPTGPLNEVGVKLLVTPRIYGVSNVFLDLKPEISELGPTAFSNLGGRTVTSPTFNKKLIKTEAMVPSGNTLVLGGLREDGVKSTRTKVPVLGDLPGLGAMFRSSSKERNKRDLLIFITPTIVMENDYQSGERSREFLKRAAQEPNDAEWSEWDSTKPHDWTKPVE